MSAVASAPWALAYRPLRGRTLLVQLGLLVAVEVLLFRSYRGHEAGFHWATHFLVGLTAAAVVNLAWLALKGAPARGQLAWVLGLHLFAMTPDLLFSRAEIPHDEWMDVFLLHVSAHYIPGGASTWLAIALPATGGYVYVLSRWLAARGTEAEAGLPPAIGVGGGSLLRPQSSPVEKPLAHVRYGPAQTPDALLLHGLGASRTLWRDVATGLEDRGRSVLVPDLLGFGASREIGTRFGLEEHVAAVMQLLDHYRAGPMLVASHSFGCAVAAGLARAAPERVTALVLISPPVFRDAERARERLGRRGWLAKQVLRGSPVASLTCGLMCLARPLAGHAAARLVRELPEQVARDSVQHSWPAYRDALATLLEDNPLPEAVADPQLATTIVLADEDEETPSEGVLAWPHERVDVIELAGDHLLPLRRAPDLMRIIEQRI